MTPDEIETILKQHALWLRDYTKGSRANLTGADLTGADLTQANLTDADLTGASLRWANLTGANLTGANLTDADLTGANLTGASLRWADLEKANLTKANLEGASLRWADLDYQIQKGLLQEIANTVLEQPNRLEMSKWHSKCGTTHCLAGWACTLNPVAKVLEETHGAQIAGLLTLGEEAHSYFYEDNKTVLNWLQTKV